MRIPNGMTEEEVVEIITRISKRLADIYVFSYHTYEDIVQEGIIIGIQGLEKYDENRPLENFMWVHIRNRLSTFKRDNYLRLVSPCLKCPFHAYIKKTDTCTKYESKDLCDLYHKWTNKNDARKNVISPIGLPYVCPDDEDGMKFNLDYNSHVFSKDIVELIDKHVSNVVRPYWLILKGGDRLNKPEHTKLLDEVQRILEEHNIEYDEKG